MMKLLIGFLRVDLQKNKTKIGGNFLNEIIFTDMYKSIPIEYYPIPSSSFLPEWYKEIQSYYGAKKDSDGNGNINFTIKKCMPVFDSISAGYLILSPADIKISQRFNNDLNTISPYYEWASFNLIEFHPAEQAYNYPNKNNNFSYPKWMNPWSIKTPKGYSVLFIQPMHRASVFTILPGIVDTDKYTSPVNFPFVLNNVEFEGIIPAGTPIAQIFPFKRESWKMKIGKEKNHQEAVRDRNLLRTRFLDSYKFQFRTKKIYN